MFLMSSILCLFWMSSLFNNFRSFFFSFLPFHNLSVSFLFLFSICALHFSCHAPTYDFSVNVFPVSLLYFFHSSFLSSCPLSSFRFFLVFVVFHSHTFLYLLASVLRILSICIRSFVHFCILCIFPSV